MSAPLALPQSILRDIPYVTDSTGTYHADLYQPAQTVRAPAVVLIHGGSWRSGNKSEMSRFATDLAGHGNHDHLIPYSQATTFIAALQGAGDKVTPFVAEGGGHSYWKKRKYYAANLRSAEDFLDSVLRQPSDQQKP